ncbi:MFS transporter [Chishuiella sp.]|uniref:MFS transporter n=1 Tax=Chishuiella sp. TaxID=1969467 RepID=UPI0028A8A4CF|nr:MFS transporter [Chishuiella sp.]
MKNSTVSVTQTSKKLFIIAWILGLIFYFIDYVTRSAPSLMLTDLATNYSISEESLVSLVGSYYYTYAICALVAGVCLDKFGAKNSMFAGCFILGIGCIIFVVSSQFVGEVGRLLQGAGSAFAFPGCVYLASKGFSKKFLATAIGFTQCVGMLGGAAGQFLVSPLLDSIMDYKTFWVVSGVLCIIPAFAMLLMIPKPSSEETLGNEKASYIEPFKVIFKNKDSWLTGLISGLLFAPTTVFAMTWAVKFFKMDLGYEAHEAAITASMAALGWVVGCPLMGMLSDKLGLRKPVIILGCLGMILSLLQLVYLPDLFNAKLTFFLFGIFSGVAMIPYSVIKEANPDNVKGSSTGVQNFITFGVTSLSAPFFASMYGNDLTSVTDKLGHYHSAIWFWIVGIIIAIVFTMLLKETGEKANKAN